MILLDGSSKFQLKIIEISNSKETHPNRISTNTLFISWRRILILILQIIQTLH